MLRAPAGRAFVALILLGAAGVAIRVGAAATAPIWFDEATTGLMGRDVLHGRFPFFFYGQSFMGAVDGYLHALSFDLFGESVGTLRIWAVLLSLAYAGLAVLLASRVFGAGRWAAVLALVPSPYLLKWAADARLHYDALLLLTPLSLLLGLAALDTGRSAPGRVRAMIVLGLVGGLCWWINLLIVPVLVACILTLAVWRPRVDRAAALAPIAFLVGSLPVWLFAAVYGRLPILSVGLVAPRQMREHGRRLLANALPRLAGIPDTFMHVRTLGVIAVTILAVGMVLALSDSRAARSGRLLLGLAVAVSLAGVLVTERGHTLATEDPRYLLPVLALLPVILGGALGRVARRYGACAAASALALVLAQGAAAGAAYPALRSPGAWRTARATLAAPTALAAALADRGLTAIYTHDPDVLTFTGRGRLTASHFYLADDSVRSASVDAAASVAYLTSGRLPDGFAQSVAAAGIGFDREAGSAGTLLTNFRLEPVAYREIPATEWSATASAHAELAGHAIDRDAGTRWRLPGRPADAWLQVDLGRTWTVGMVTWLPGTYQEVPVGFRLDTSTDGSRWTLGREAPVYYGPLYWAAGHPMGRVRWGRVEARFPARPARYVRVTHLGADSRFAWTVRELFVYEAAERSSLPVIDVAAAVAALHVMGARHLYADHGEGPRLAGAADGQLVAVADNVRVDAYGLTPPLERLPFLVPAPDSAVVYPAGAPSGPAIDATLRAAGVDFSATEAGGYRLLGRLGPAVPAGRALHSIGARLTAAPGRGDPRAAGDGRLDTRWSTGQPQAPGQWLQVELDAPAELVGVELDLGEAAYEYPRNLAVQVMRDAGWSDTAATVRWVGPLVWTGTHVLRAGAERVVVSFPTTRARALRIVQTGRDAFYPWSVAELRLLAP